MNASNEIGKYDTNIYRKRKKNITRNILKPQYLIYN